MLRIAGKIYEVKEFDPQIAPDCMGREVYEKSTIYIRNDMPDDVKRETLLHEIIHILYANAYLKPGDEEERVVGTLSNGLFQVLEDNDMWKVTTDD